MDFRERLVALKQKARRRRIWNAILCAFFAVAALFCVFIGLFWLLPLAAVATAAIVTYLRSLCARTEERLLGLLLEWHGEFAGDVAGTSVAVPSAVSTGEKS